MNLFKSVVFYCAIATTYHLDFAMSTEIAAQKYIFKKLDAVEKYHMFTRGTINNTTVLDLILPLIEQYESNDTIFNMLMQKNKNISYQHKQIPLIDCQINLIGHITGFIDVVRNELSLFYILTPGIIAHHNQTPLNPEEAEKSEWDPEMPKSLSVTDEQIKWAQEELAVELDFFIMHFLTVHDLKQKPTAHLFSLWVQGRDEWWEQEEFDRWINKNLNLTTKNRKALASIEFPVKNILFFLFDYLPKKLLSLDSKRTKITSDILKAVFPGFAIYDDENLFYVAHNAKTKQNLSFLVKMINENLAKTIKDNPTIGQKKPTQKDKAAKKQTSILSLFGVSQ